MKIAIGMSLSEIPFNFVVREISNIDEKRLWVEIYDHHHHLSTLSATASILDPQQSRFFVVSVGGIDMGFARLINIGNPGDKDADSWKVEEAYVQMRYQETISVIHLINYFFFKGISRNHFENDAEDDHENDIN